MMKAEECSDAASRFAPVCKCGNSRAHEGFYPCDMDGRRLKAGNPEILQCCSRCGRITEIKTQKLAGYRSFALPS